MRTRTPLGLLVVTLALTAPLAPSAQTTELPAVQFSWGAMHRGPGQALAINFVVPDAPEFGDPSSFAAALRLMDADGRVLYETTAQSVSGRVLSFVIASEDRATKTIPGDAYAIIDSNNRVIQASIKVAPLSERVVLPPERIVSTLEVIEISSGRVLAFANTPRVSVPDAPD